MGIDGRGNERDGIRAGGEFHRADTRGTIDDLVTGISGSSRGGVES